jgi:PAS domain S-box-containing protein
MTDRFAALDLSPDWYAVVSADLTIVWVNLAFAAGFGLARDDLVGKGVFEAFPEARGAGEMEGQEIIRRSVSEVFCTGLSDRIALHGLARPAESLDGRPVFSIRHSAILGPDGAVELVLAHLTDATELARLLSAPASVVAASANSPELAHQVLSTALELEASNRALNADRDRLRQMFDQAPGFMALLTGPDHVFDLVNAAYRRLVGDRPLLGLPARIAVPDIFSQGYGATLHQVYATGEAFVGRALAVEVDNGDGARHQHFVDFVFQPLTTTQGEVFGVFLQGHDVTEQVLAARAQQLLMRELQHRIKNTLSTVRAIAARSARTTSDPAAFVKAFEDRLIALAATHELLTQGKWEGADVRDLVERELRPYDISRLRLRGDSQLIPPRAALPLGLALHELATNAAKYGALSTDRGRVELEWWAEDRSDGPRLRVQWREFDGPEVGRPSRRGFGTELLDGMMRRGAEPVLDFARTGLSCSFDLPIGPALGRPASSQPQDRGAAPQTHA